MERAPQQPISRRALLGGLGPACLAIAGCTAETPPTPGPTVTPEPSPTSPTPSPSPTPTPSPSPTAEPTPSNTGTPQAELDQALRDAAWANDVALARELVLRGADVNAKDETEQSAYLVAASEGHLELLRLCLVNGAIVNDLDSWNGTGLIRAAERGHGPVVGELLQAGIDRDHVNRIGYQAIHEAVWLGEDTPAYHDTIRLLAAGGAELTRPSGSERLTPLQMAGEKGLPGTAAILEAMTTADAVADPAGRLLAAAEQGDANTVALALRAGADIESRDSRDRTALLLASAADRLDVARLLVALGADVNALDGRSDTPWLVTGVTGSVAMLEVLLPHRPDFTILNRFGGTSLIPACERGHVEYVRRVVTTGVDINHVNDLGWTGLLEAVILGDGGPAHQEIVTILLANGADRNIPDGDGVTALEHARAKGQTRIVALLEA